jgi:hypothetical protein
MGTFLTSFDTCTYSQLKRVTKLAKLQQRPRVLVLPRFFENRKHAGCQDFPVPE